MTPTSEQLADLARETGDASLFLDAAKEALDELAMSEPNPGRRIDLLRVKAWLGEADLRAPFGEGRPVVNEDDGSVGIYGGGERVKVAPPAPTGASTS